jgi:hypothetical protein
MSAENGKTISREAAELMYTRAAIVGVRARSFRTEDLQDDARWRGFVQTEPLATAIVGFERDALE